MIKFLVTIIKTIKEKIIEIVIPWKAEITSSRSTSIVTQADEVCLPFYIVGASVFASSFTLSM